MSDLQPIWLSILQNNRHNILKCVSVKHMEEKELHINSAVKRTQKYKIIITCIILANRHSENYKNRKRFISFCIFFYYKMDSIVLKNFYAQYFILSHIICFIFVLLYYFLSLTSRINFMTLLEKFEGLMKIIIIIFIAS